MTTNLNDTAPYPQTEQDATADTVAKHLTAQAYATSSETYQAGLDAVAPGATPDKTRAYVTALARLTDQFAAVYLLRALDQHAPDKADEVARGLWECWQDGSAMPELLHDWLVEHGIDPDEVDKATAEEAA